MNKPLSLIIDETKQSIIDILNNSQLHPSIMDAVVKDIYEEVHKAMLLQAEKEKKEYEQSLKDDDKEES